MLALPDQKSIIGGVTFTRITAPFMYLREHGYPADWIPWQQARVAAALRKGNITDYDVYVLQRAGTDDGRLIAFCQTMREAGKIVVWESDDDYTNEHRVVLEADAVGVANACTALTVSTLGLRKQMAKYVSRPIYLLQNNIDLRYWDSVKFKRIVPSPSVGLVGTPTHYDDWQAVVDVLERIASERPDVHFVVGGLLPEYLQDLPRMTYLPGVEYKAYPAMVAQIDIGLAPLVPNDPFNWSKSGIKAMEYWCAGAPVVASDALPYQRVVTEDRGFLVDHGDPDAWYAAIMAYLDNPGLRRQHAAAGREWVRKNRSMERNAILWWAVYEELYKKYGGQHERFISQRTMGNRPANGEGGSGNHLPPVSSYRRTRRGSNHHQSNATRGRRRPNNRRRA
ncbi:MAG: glycosyltransferase [Anaerolineae bacterium]|nr:glycosyltransferase [Anaerolineae bacterium]